MVKKNTTMLRKKQREENTPVEHPGRGPGSTGQGGRMAEDRGQS